MRSKRKRGRKVNLKMAAVSVESPARGFSFENCRRNVFLASQGFPAPKFTKTGTTIAGIVFKDGVILGADTRATSGGIVADKNCAKIHYLAPNIYCCGAGTAADTDKTTALISSQLELHHLATGRQVPVRTANKRLKEMLFRYQGHIAAAFVLGGVDSTGGSIYNIYPHGSTDRLPYATMGSGSLAAMAVFERDWKPDINLDEGMQLVRDAIAAGIFNDLGSGNNVDLCVITKDGKNYIRPYEEASKKGEKHLTYKYKKGTTSVLASTTIHIDVEDVAVEAMDTSS